jgi:murein DD-endopeptidase
MRITAPRSRQISYVLLLAGLMGLAACSSAPPRQEPAGAASTAAGSADIDASRRHVGLAIAAGMVGSPYRYGGETPGGFDCSGLVYYSFRKAGIEVPRTTREQFKHSHPVRLSQLEPGDLLFFKVNWRKASHVGIYAGDGRFVHAPSSGKEVTYARLDDPYWHKRLKGARRFD